MRHLAPAALFAATVASLLASPQGSPDSPAPSLTFHAPFDGGLDAAFARGDARLYSASSRKEVAQMTAGAPADALQIVPRAGRHGDAVRVALKSSPLVFFKGERNIAWTRRDWSGTVSVWFSLDPDRDLLPGYSDPLIITPRAWNDAALFVDFTRDDVPRKFRFAAFADRAVWDPAKREWEAVPVAERPMIELAGGRFAAGRWTHVAWTWERFNTAGPEGVLTAYIDGAPVGTLSGRPQTYTWDPAEVLIAFGVQFRGLMDELSIFDRALTAAEIQALHGLPGGVRAWHPAAR
jgi:Concanavalin A-like lectin/glucanases superfamily